MKKTEKEDLFDINVETFKLLSQEPFYAAWSRMLTKVANEGVSTAGVCCNSEHDFMFYYSPFFMSNISAEARLDVIKHEILHLELGHCTNRSVPMVDRKHPTKEERRAHNKANIAADLAINSYLEHLPKDFFTKGSTKPGNCCKPGEGKFVNCPPFKSMEWYLGWLEQHKDELKSNGVDLDAEDCEGSFDQHDWDNMSDEDKEIIKEKIRQATINAVGEVQKSGNWGSVPVEMQKMLLKLIKTKVNAEKVLSWFINKSIKGSKSKTQLRVSRRMPYVYAGTKSTHHAKIAVAIDMSGSVSNELLAKFFAICQRFADKVEFTVIPFDTAVSDKDNYVWKKGKKMEGKRVRCGGTDFDAPTQWINKHGGFDGLVICTDMCAPAPGPCKVQRIYVTNEEGAANAPFVTKDRVCALPMSAEQ